MTIAYPFRHRIYLLVGLVCGATLPIDAHAGQFDGEWFGQIHCFRRDGSAFSKAVDLQVKGGTVILRRFFNGTYGNPVETEGKIVLEAGLFWEVGDIDVSGVAIWGNGRTGSWRLGGKWDAKAITLSGLRGNTVCSGTLDRDLTAEVIVAKSETPTGRADEPARKADDAALVGLRKELEESKAAERERRAREAELEQANKARESEIARLKTALEQRRQAAAQSDREDVSSRKAGETELARLRRELEASKSAERERRAREAELEKATKAREAEIAQLRREVEDRYWVVAKNSQDPAGVQDYLQRFPKGRYVGEARARVALLSATRDLADVEFGQYHALVIGIADYQHLPKLKTAINDAKAVAKVLQDHYGFKVKMLIDPKRTDIIDALDEYRESLGTKDNLLIYYAGHGWLDEEVERGYWLPVDSQRNRRGQWMSNATITDTLKGLNAKHVMVVADSCYSGTLVRGTDMGVRNRTGDYWKQMAGKWARVAITSGGLEPVADVGGSGHSPFAKAFIDALSNNATVMDGTQLFSQMRRPVMVAAKQTPQYADVRQAGHEGGDFIFVRKK